MWGGTEPIGEVWYTATADQWPECDGGAQIDPLTRTELANPADIIANHEAYEVSINGIALPFAYPAEAMVGYADADADVGTCTIVLFISIEDENSEITVTACDSPIYGQPIEVTVTHK